MRDEQKVSEPQSLGEALPKVMAHVRDVVIPAYDHPALNGAGAIAILMMKTDMDRAAVAMAEGDLPGMIAAYKALKDYKL